MPTKKITKKVTKKKSKTVKYARVQAKRVLRLELWIKVMFGMVLGVIAGLIFGEKSHYFKPLGTIFINLVKMVIVPLVFFSLVSAMTNLASDKNINRVGIKSIFAFLMTAMFAVLIGITFGNLFDPGTGISPETIESLRAHAGSVPVPATPAPVGLLETFLSIIPDNAVGAMAQGHILQIVVFSLFTGFTLNKIKDKVPHLLVIIKELAQYSFKMIEIVVRFSPFGVFGFISWMVGTQGLGTLAILLKLFLIVTGACIFQYLLFGILIKFFTNLSPMPFYRKMVEPQILAFSTSSSKAALSTTMRVLQEKMGVSKTSSNFVLPLGASMNMDGTAIYLAICAIFFSQIEGHTLMMHDYIVLLFTCTVASIGAAGIPSGSIIFMGMVLGSVGLSMDYIALILGIDRILDMIRTTINITGDATVTLIIDSTEKMHNEKVYYADNLTLVHEEEA